ncbi:DNA primase [Chloroflexota bacterium]
MSAINEVKQRTDIVEIIGQYTTLVKAGRNFRALCPFHSEKRPSFFVYPEQQSWHCFGACSTGGDVFSFVMKKEGIDFGEALRLLAQRAGVTIPSRSGQDTRKDERERLYKVNEAAAQYFHNLLLNSPTGEKARNYLDSRGLSLNTIIDFQLGFSPNSWEALKGYLMERGYTEGELLEVGLLVETEEGKTHDRFRNRLMFPIKDARSNTIGFGARALDDSLPKYLNSPQTPIFDKSSTLYGINLAAPAIRQQDLAVIVEGYMDVITAHQNSFTNVVAAMGVAVTEKQVSGVKRLTRNVVLALDADAAGEEAMLRCVGYENGLDTEVKVVILPKDKDPDDVIKGDATMWQYFVEEALPAVDYTFNMVTAELDLTTAKDKTLAVGKLLPIITEIKDSTRQDHYLTKLSKLTATSYRSLETALNRIKSNRRAQEPKSEVVTRAVRPLLSNPLEEYCLALLLQHSEFKGRSEGLLPEYFENSENCEIYVAWQQANDLSSLRDKLDATLWEYLDALINKNVLASQIEQKYTDCVLNLRKKFLQNLEARKAEILALEAETGGTGADLAKLEEEGIESSIQLREVFAKKARNGQGR